jgi:hypothetical protein
MSGDGSSFSGPAIETEDERGFVLDGPTVVDNPAPCLSAADELLAWEAFGHWLSMLVFGRVETVAAMVEWLNSQSLSSLVSCDVARPACYSLDSEPCAVDSSGDCRGPLGVARLFMRRSIL